MVEPICIGLNLASVTQAQKSFVGNDAERDGFLSRWLNVHKIINRETVLSDGLSQAAGPMISLPASVSAHVDLPVETE